MNIFDKYVIENLKLVKVEFAVVIIAYIINILISDVSLFINPGVSIILLITLIATYLPLYFAYKKLFYDTVYGNSAGMFNQFPVTTEEIVAGKILVVSIIALAIQMVVLAGIKITGQNLFEGMETSFVLGKFALNTVYYVVASAATGSVLFFAIAFYHLVPKVLRGNSRLGLSFIIFIALESVNVKGVSFLAEIFNYENLNVICTAEITVSFVLLIVSAYITVKMLKSTDKE